MSPSIHKIKAHLALMDSLDPRAEQTGASTPGRHIVLPSSYAGSPRNMLGHYQDSMAMVSQLGAPGKIACGNRFSSSNGVIVQMYLSQ